MYAATLNELTSQLSVQNIMLETRGGPKFDITPMSQKYCTCQANNKISVAFNNWGAHLHRLEHVFHVACLEIEAT